MSAVALSAVASSAPGILLIGSSGYIGCFLQERLRAAGHAVTTCDIGWRGDPLGAPDLVCDYAALTCEQLAPFSRVLWFAGHASVGAAVADPQGALHNNCVNLLRLRERMRAGARLIYASTASLYSTGLGEAEVVAATESDRIVGDINAYDISKACFDTIAQGFLRDFVGLRLGTVCGMSANLRRELIFNAMNIAALERGEVMVGNASASRSILFLEDLAQAVMRCVELETLEGGFLNLASASATIGALAEAIAGHHGARLRRLPDTPTYSFRLNTRKAQQMLQMRFNDDLGYHCERFREGYA